VADAAYRLLMDDSLRTEVHPPVVFTNGPAGRRARLILGPDVWEVVRAVREVRTAEPDLSGDEVRALVSETSGVPEDLVQAAIAYWAAYPEEIDEMIERAEAEERASIEQWQRPLRRCLGGSTFSV
jgi:hypothetical protein